MGFDFDVVNKIMNEVESKPELKEYADWVLEEFFQRFTKG